MPPISSSNQIVGEICEALGLKYVISLALNIELGKVVTIEVKYYPEA